VRGIEPTISLKQTLAMTAASRRQNFAVFLTGTNPKVYNSRALKKRPSLGACKFRSRRTVSIKNVSLKSHSNKSRTKVEQNSNKSRTKVEQKLNKSRTKVEQKSNRSRTKIEQKFEQNSNKSCVFFETVFYYQKCLERLQPSMYQKWCLPFSKESQQDPSKFHKKYIFAQNIFFPLFERPCNFLTFL
jgi:hypothetical protein